MYPLTGKRQVQISSPNSSRSRSSPFNPRPSPLSQDHKHFETAVNGLVEDYPLLPVVAGGLKALGKEHAAIQAKYLSDTLEHLSTPVRERYMDKSLVKAFYTDSSAATPVFKAFRTPLLARYRATSQNKAGAGSKEVTGYGSNTETHNSPEECGILARSTSKRKEPGERLDLPEFGRNGMTEGGSADQSFDFGSVPDASFGDQGVDSTPKRQRLDFGGRSASRDVEDDDNEDEEGDKMEQEGDTEEEEDTDPSRTYSPSEQEQGIAAPKVVRKPTKRKRLQSSSTTTNVRTPSNANSSTSVALNTPVDTRTSTSDVHSTPTYAQTPSRQTKSTPQQISAGNARAQKSRLLRNTRMEILEAYLTTSKHILAEVARGKASLEDYQAAVCQVLEEAETVEKAVSETRSGRYSRTPAPTPTVDRILGRNPHSQQQDTPSH